MAQVDRANAVDIDHLLARSLAAWESIPDVSRDIDGWDLEDQLAFIEEWPLEEERLMTLATFARADLFTPEQRTRYACLISVVQANRPTVEQLLRT